MGKKVWLFEELAIEEKMVNLRNCLDFCDLTLSITKPTHL